MELLDKTLALYLNENGFRVTKENDYYVHYIIGSVIEQIYEKQREIGWFRVVDNKFQFKTRHHEGELNPYDPRSFPIFLKVFSNARDNDIMFLYFRFLAVLVIPMAVSILIMTIILT